jgi:hypothetical protein
VECKWTDSSTMDCPDVCLEASVGRLSQEVLLEESYSNECSETVRVGRLRVSEEFLTFFNCSVLTFWSAIKFHRE